MSCLRAHAASARIETALPTAMATRSPAPWPDEAPPLAQELHGQLRLDDRDWHRLKSNADRRAAELLSGALVQLLQGGERADVEALINQGLLWLRRELKDPGCPQHR